MEDSARGRAMVSRRISWPPDHHREDESPQPRQSVAETAEIGAILQAISRAAGGGGIATDPKEDADCYGRRNDSRKGRDADGIEASSRKYAGVHRGNHGARSQ